MQNPHKVLNVSQSASEAEIKKAYRKLAKKYHPDKNQGNATAEAKFKEVGEAYKRITEPESFTHEAPEGFGTSAGGINVDDFINNMFGGRQNLRQGQDYRVGLTISFKESCFGVKKHVEFTVEEVCGGCNGQRAKKGDFTNCVSCKGSGQRIFKRGFVTISGGVCPTCRGEGVKITKSCSDCSGLGMANKTCSHDINVPPMISNGITLRVPGAGAPFPGGHPGNLLLLVTVTPQDGMERIGQDIYSRKSITLKDALLGTTINVDTLHGQENIKVPECTQHGQKLGIKGKGAKHQTQNNFGKHIVIMNIVFPKKLTDKQKDAIKIL